MVNILMTVSFYRQKWQRIQDGFCSPEKLTRLARQIAFSFMDTYLKDYRYEEDYIDLLCEMTTFSQNPQLNLPGSQALFGIIIESLCDDFEELQTITYNKVMSQIISYCRGIPAGRRLDDKLTEFGINSGQDLVQRIQSIRGNKKHFFQSGKIGKVIVLSRVTIGADVAITSIILQCLQSILPEAQIVIVGRDKLDQIYGANNSVSLKFVPYTRNGDLLERLSSWHKVLDIINEELQDTSLEETILLDPDSRLSQLGVLPLFPEERYFFFDSRSDKALLNKLSMPELVNAWLSELLGREVFFYPRVWLNDLSFAYAKKLTYRLYHAGAQRIIVVNLGYGGNPRKRIGLSFESQMLLTLLKEPYTVVILDQGLGVEEAANTEALLHEVKKQGYPVEKSTFQEIAAITAIDWGVLAIETQIGEIASLISCSDEFIGYDSACQHIAAALEVPCITIFAGSNNMRFIRRWSAFGKNSSQIVHADTLNHPLGIDVQDLVTRIMHQRYARALTINH